MSNGDGVSRGDRNRNDERQDADPQQRQRMNVL